MKKRQKDCSKRSEFLEMYTFLSKACEIFYLSQGFEKILRR